MTDEATSNAPSTRHPMLGIALVIGACVVLAGMDATAKYLVTAAFHMAPAGFLSPFLYA